MQRRQYVLSAMSSDALADPTVVPDQRSSKATLAELRRTRQRRRLGDTDWYDIAYRVYLFALVGLTLVVWVSDAVDGAIGDEVVTADLLTRGTVGDRTASWWPRSRSACAAVPTAGQSPSRSPTSATCCSSPISRRSVMLRPVAQRLRAAAFALALGRRPCWAS
jgi:hypothetical protein